jgi:VanZ family protein
MRQWISRNLDKICHALACALITIVITGMMLKVTESLVFSVIGGAVVAVLVGVYKELVDKYDGEEFDKMDLLADCIGTVIGVILSIIIL